MSSPKTLKRQLMTKPYRHQEISSTTKVSPSAAARGDRRVQELAKAKARVKKLVAMFRTRNTYSKACTFSDTSLAPKSKDTTATTEIDPDNHAKEKPSSAETDSFNSAMASIKSNLSVNQSSAWSSP
ncbi:hypothetical protein BGZ91_002317 [Linnemannia elongata]|nr:hypothetical protein BGZ91_002317 [Linnemannia elongata]